MKIAFFSVYHPYVAGVVTFLDVLSQEYIKQGHEVVIFTQEGATNPLQEKGVRLVTIFGAPSLVYPTMKITFPNPLTFTDTIRKEAPDIIHVNTPDLMSEMAVRAGKKLGIPTIITFHTLFTEEYDEYASLARFLHLTQIPFPKITSYDNSKKWLIQTLIRKHFQKFDIVTISTPLTKKLVERQGIACQLVPIGLDINTFHQKKDYTKTNKMLSVSRLGFEKKIGIVLLALQKLPDPKPHLTIIGDGPALQMLESLTTELGLLKHVTFIGNIPRSALQEYFNSHDFFVNASDTETFGYVTAEAMAGGLPIVGMQSQGTGELVQEGVNGFLAKPNNPESFAKAIKRMLAQENYTQMGTASYNMVQIYSPENSAKEHLNLYKRAIEKFGK
jgi:glycosyltransferase involved in cell wall biosynthesis